MKIEKIKINNLIEYENNAKIHTEKQVNQIANSIKQFGFNDPLAIDENNIIIEGHGRLYALQKLGYEEVECIRLEHLTEEEKKAYILAHNKLNLNTGFDLEMLEEELASIYDIDMSEFGFDIDKEIESLFKEDEEVIEEILEEDVENKEPASKQGEIYILGNHRLMCGDSSNSEHVKQLIGDETIDLLCTDPPYNVDHTEKSKYLAKYKPNNRVENGHNVIMNDKMGNDEFLNFLTKVFTNVDNHLKKGGVFYIWYSSSVTYNFLTALNNVGWEMKQNLIWLKNHFVLGRQDYHYKHEPCIYGWKNGAAHNWYSDRKQTTILEFDKPLRSAEHPTMKPVDLISYIISNSSKKEDNVLDLFGGSGTTLIACEQLNRKCYMMEYDPVYVDVIIKRWENLTGQKAVKWQTNKI